MNGGSFVCQKKNFASGYACKYSCTGSKVPGKIASTTCMEVKNSSGAVIDYEWEPIVEPGAESKFKCVKTMK